MQYHIKGTTMQTLHIELEKGESVYTEAGALQYMSPSISMETNFTGGLGGVFKRMVTGNSAVLNHFLAKSKGVVSFTTRLPGHIIPVDVSSMPIHVQRHSFLCAEESVNLELQTAFNLKGIFGGNGLLYNKLSGAGFAFVSVDGEASCLELEEGQTILVHAGHLAAYEEQVSFSLERLKGFKNMFLGQDGIFLAKLTGKGKIWVHSLTIHSLAEALMPYISTERTSGGGLLGILDDIQ